MSYEQDYISPERLEMKERREAVRNAPTWLEAKEQRLLLNSTTNLMPTDEMFLDGGMLYPTKLYPPSRIKSQCTYNPVKYDLEYVIDFYQQRVIKQLSMENQLTLLEAITAMYVEDTYPRQGDINEYLETLTDEQKLQLCKEIADSLGKRVIKK